MLRIALTGRGALIRMAVWPIGRGEVVLKEKVGRPSSRPGQLVV